VLNQILPADWSTIIRPDTPILEIMLRGTVVYLSLFFLLRVAKRQAGAVGMADLLVVVLIADAAQNAMAANYTSLPDGLILVGTIAFWAYALDWLGYRLPRVQRLVYPDPLPLVRNGVIVRKSLAQELMTENELLSQLRLHGVDDLRKVRVANLEGDGRISVITDGQADQEAPERPVS
jgi:uncharacterized membrane protein YcaP (DUF421 family)